LTSADWVIKVGKAFLWRFGLGFFTLALALGFSGVIIRITQSLLTTKTGWNLHRDGVYGLRGTRNELDRFFGMRSTRVGLAKAQTGRQSGVLLLLQLSVYFFLLLLNSRPFIRNA
jgi:hypothetical protein